MSRNTWVTNAVMTAFRAVSRSKANLRCPTSFQFDFGLHPTVIDDQRLFALLEDGVCDSGRAWSMFTTRLVVHLSQARASVGVRRRSANQVNHVESLIEPAAQFHQPSVQHEGGRPLNQVFHTALKAVIDQPLLSSLVSWLRFSR